VAGAGEPGLDEAVHGGAQCLDPVQVTRREPGRGGAAYGSMTARQHVSVYRR
jgi:hypothetical protein